MPRIKLRKFQEGGFQTQDPICDLPASTLSIDLAYSIQHLAGFEKTKIFPFG